MLIFGVLWAEWNARRNTAMYSRPASETISRRLRLSGQRPRMSGGGDSGHHRNIYTDSLIYVPERIHRKAWLTLIARNDRMVKIDDNPWKIDARYWFVIYVLFLFLASALLLSPDPNGNSNGAESNIRGAFYMIGIIEFE